MSSKGNSPLYKHSTFLPFGITGAGKSTFLNAISKSNAFKTSASAQSCTKEVSCHSFARDNVTIKLIDTPGFCDSDGINEDQKNMDTLVDFLKNNEHGVNGVAIVINRCDCRLDQSLKKLIKLAYSLFGLNLWSRLCFIVTHCSCDPDELNELKENMVSAEDSLHASILKLIKSISQIKDDPLLPFFFVDSKRPQSSPSLQTIPIFIKWLCELPAVETNILEKVDVKYQLKEKRSSTTRALGEIHPIYEWVRGPDRYTTRTEKVPIVVKKTRVQIVKRKVDYYVDRDVDAGDFFSFGIARLFRNNRKKQSYWKEFVEFEDYDVVEYQEKQIPIKVPGETEKILKGYWQQMTLITKAYIACWGIELDTIDENNPTCRSNAEESTQNIINFFDERQMPLSFSSSGDLRKINELRRLV